MTLQPEDFWQSFAPTGGAAAALQQDCYPARFDDGRLLLLPVRPLPDGQRALASLIINQASFAVLDAIAADLAAKLVRFAPEIIVGLPTLGLTLAAAVARKLGHDRYVPFGTSRKFWYQEALSVPLSLITTPDQAKRLYLDPRMQPLLAKHRVAVIDDVISSGVSMRAGIRLLASIGVEPVSLGVAMRQSEVWRERIAPPWQARLASVMASPMLTRTPEGWVQLKDA